MDKPFAVSSSDAEALIDLAKKHGITLMSSSSLRYAEGVANELASTDGGRIIGADCFGPMPWQPTQPGYFWYGIHSVELLYKIMGPGCVRVSVSATEQHDLITGIWADGRIGTVRGNREGNQRFGALVHREGASRFVDIMAHPKPYYASLMEKIMEMFQTGIADVSLDETLEVVRFLESANIARDNGVTVNLPK